MIVLASQSPRRRELLANAGIACEVRPAGIEEKPREGETPEQYVVRLAREKAEAVEASADEYVLAADTTVVADGQVLEKPHTPEEAERMLRLLHGRDHTVLTGVCLRHQGRCWTAVESTRVWFIPLRDDEIVAYARSGEPLDKAGGYAIQGLASRFAERIEGCYFNVVGLPVSRVYRMLRAAGYNFSEG
ncbi:MAG: Maf-like protein [Bryobacteraceae bacterium]|nr:MAG: Maf-like protein [Bryobacteraceae bacterium]